MDTYQAFLEGLFICGEADVPTVIEKEQANLLIDVRAEATKSAGTEDATWVNIPLDSKKEHQVEQLKAAIDELVQAYHKGEKAVLH